ncbi:hypothetical protein A3770_06p42060 [Chloropicon primus]|uniref:RING-type E3 ubiquitin transferase n=1 Tax=Chloropicon primus TaxID=1764295 RepID=A0A5B8MM03_9CHLO|nr:hypothetical protein A3770_06p42060 [Chloropicon primus]|eukprot:QDZ21688.1 hypothetical protein A3770_06p42060 [Chloropicon primus]
MSGGSFGFDCNICLEQIKQGPVTTLCGHLFCGHCIERWLKHKGDTKDKTSCPVCKGETAIIRIFGRGSTSSNSVPCDSFDEATGGERGQNSLGKGRPPPWLSFLVPTQLQPSLLLIVGIAVFAYILLLL